jgi:hypothetical protein
LHDLKSEVVNQNKTGFLVCPTCWDPDQPQYQLGKIPISEIEAVRNPRPDLGVDASRYGSFVGGVQIESVRDDFLTDADGWSAANASIAVAYVSANKSIEVTEVSTGSQHKITKSVSIDSSIYKNVRASIQLTTRPDPFEWLGRMHWTGGNSKQIESPNFYAMGDNKHVLTWDMLGNSDWTGTVNLVEFELFGSNALNGVYELDYIRFNFS